MHIAYTTDVQIWLAKRFQDIFENPAYSGYIEEYKRLSYEHSENMELRRVRLIGLEFPDP